MPNLFIHQLDANGQPSRQFAVDAIRHFAAPATLEALLRQYGGERAFAEANLAHYSDVRIGTYVLLEDGNEVARAEYGCVTRTEVTA
jgi:hypothetical protein